MVRFVLVLVLATWILVSSASAAFAYSGSTDFDGEARGDALEVLGRARSKALHDPRRPTASALPISSIQHNCVPLDEGTLRCYTALLSEPGILAVTVDDPGTADPISQEQLDAAVVSELRRLPLAPSGITVQPPNGWTLVNVDTIVHTDARTQTFATSVLGIPIQVRARPTTFTWTFGDTGAPLVTTDPGAPWPDATLRHTYRAPGTYTISLTTEWTGEYLVDGTTAWQPILGTATTTQAAPPLDVVEATNALVTGP